MAKVSKDTASKVDELGPVSSHSEEVEGYSIDFVTFHDDIDPSGLYRGLPNDRCQCPHWGYVKSGAFHVRYADREEVYEAGDAFYMAPDHVPFRHEPGTEIVLFSPTEELKLTEEAMARNAAAFEAAR